MKLKLKVSTYAGKRKHIELTKNIRDNFENGEEVIVEKSKNTKKNE